MLSVRSMKKFLPKRTVELEVVPVVTDGEIVTKEEFEKFRELSMLKSDVTLLEKKKKEIEEAELMTNFLDFSP